MPIIAFVLLIVLLIVFWPGLCVAFNKEKPEYLVLEIPMIQPSSSYSSTYAESEEFSTFIWHDSGHKYFIWRMYTSGFLGCEGYNSIEDIEAYYHEHIINLGWEETQNYFCNSQMTEFQPENSYRAYVYPTQYYKQPVACLAIWSESEDGNYIDVLIKTINPSWNVLWDMDW